MNQTPTGYSQKKCNQCGSPLIMLGKKKEKIGNYPDVTITTYRCSNKECQDDTDKKTLARIKLSSEQQVAKEKRLKTKKRVNLRLNKNKILR